jgi:GTP cyclohydrolase FolE2
MSSVPEISAASPPCLSRLPHKNKMAIVDVSRATKALMKIMNTFSNAPIEKLMSEQCLRKKKKRMSETTIAGVGVVLRFVK